ncbi:MAG: nuclear transport factor 2 family protein [Acidimicrobiales bacterium]|nr:nuclear transport factor 2 family protein [Acidimicrobiales bacterium]MBO0893555.1 nuclear transport factor 2 family protein [Acidimicrobiales bacterium]
MPDSSRSEEERAKELVRSFFGVLSSGDLDALKGFFDERSCWAVGTAGEGRPPRTGPDDIVENFLRPVREGMFEPAQPKVDPEHVWAEGSWVTVEARGRGQLKNGNAYDNRYVFIVEVAGDKIRTIREYMDTAYAGRVSGRPVDQVASS